VKGTLFVAWGILWPPADFSEAHLFMSLPILIRIQYSQLCRLHSLSQRRVRSAELCHARTGFSCQLLCFAVPQGGRPAEPTGKSAPATFKKTFSESVTVRSFAWKDLKFTYPAPTKMDCKSGPPVRDSTSSTLRLICTTLALHFKGFCTSELYGDPRNTGNAAMTEPMIWRVLWHLPPPLPLWC
jgi:hypothetical protein